MSTWTCVNCEAVIKENDHEKPNVDWKPRPGASGKWDGYCRECGVLAHKPKKERPRATTAKASASARCSATTKKGQPCPINADRVDENGEAWCHVHDANGTYQQQRRPRRRGRDT